MKNIIITITLAFVVCSIGYGMLKTLVAMIALLVLVLILIFLLWLAEKII